MLVICRVVGRCRHVQAQERYGSDAGARVYNTGHASICSELEVIQVLEVRAELSGIFGTSLCACLEKDAQLSAINACGNDATLNHLVLRLFVNADG
jgi:hypothetical protein